MQDQNQNYINFEQLEKKREELIKELKTQKFFEGFKDTLTKLYTQSGHFIYELIQNAEDCDASEVIFELSSEKLVFTHNGTKLFQLEDVDAITNIGNSTKTDNGNSIGKFGVGFKSVFEYTKTPTVHSGDFHFVIKDLFIPHSISDDKFEFNKNTIFVLPFDVDDKSKQDCFLQIMKALKELPNETLLFLRHINRIIYKYDQEKIILERKEINAPLSPKNLCALTKTNDAMINYVRFFDTVIVTEKGNQNAEENKAKTIEIAIAFKAELNEKNGWSIKPIINGDSPCGKVFTFFPCEAEHSGLCFHIHAPFALTVAREKLRYEIANIEIKEKLEKLLEKSLDSIKSSNLLNMDFLKALPNKDDSLGSYDIFKNIKEKFNSEPYMPMQNGTFGAAKEKLRSKNAISELFDDSDMNKIYGTSGVTYWIKNPRLQNQRDDKFIQGLDCKEFNFADFLVEYYNSKYKYDNIQESLKNPNFVILEAQKEIIQRYEEIESIFTSKDAKWFVKLYKQFLHIKMLNDSTIHFENEPNLYYSNYEIQEIRNLPLCLCEDGKLRKFSECYLPSKSEKHSDYPDNVFYIHEGIIIFFKNNDFLKEFFSKLGVQEFSQNAILKRKITTFLSGVKDCKTFVEIFREYQKLSEKDSDLLEPLSKSYCLLTTDKIHHNPTYIYVPDCYNQEKSYKCIPEYYECYNKNSKTERNSKYFYEVSNEYLNFLNENEITAFFYFLKSTGCITTVKIQQCSCHKNPLFWDIIWQEAEGYGHGNSQPTDIDFTIPYLDEFLKNPSIEKFEFVWSILKNSPLQQRINWTPRDISFCYYANAQKYHEKKYPSQLVAILKNSKWIAQIENNEINFVKPNQAYTSKLPKYSYQNDTSVNGNLIDWLSRIDFGKEEKENQAEYQKKLNEEKKHKEDLERFSNELGFSSDLLSELEQAKKESLLGDGSEILDYVNSLRQAKEERNEVYSQNSETPKNTTHFQEKILENYNDADDIEYEKRERSVRSSNNAAIKETAKIKLRERYTSSLNGTMICQLCHNPMPFKDKEDKDFFVTRQLFSKDIFVKESDENYIALCPTCYAKFNIYFTPKDEEKQNALLEDIKENNGENTDFALTLDYDYKLHFDKKHILALYTCLTGEVKNEIKQEESATKKVVIKIKNKNMADSEKITAFCINCHNTFLYSKSEIVITCDKCKTSYQNSNGVIGRVLSKTTSNTETVQEVSFEQLKKAIELTRVEPNGYVLCALLSKSLEQVLGKRPSLKMRKIVNQFLDKLDVIEAPAFSVKLKE